MKTWENAELVELNIKTARTRLIDGAELRVYFGIAP